MVGRRSTGRWGTGGVCASGKGGASAHQCLPLSPLTLPAPQALPGAAVAAGGAGGAGHDGQHVGGHHSHGHKREEGGVRSGWFNTVLYEVTARGCHNCLKCHHNCLHNRLQTCLPFLSLQVRNFPAHRGTVVGLIRACVGLSGAASSRRSVTVLL